MSHDFLNPFKLILLLFRPLSLFILSRAQFIISKNSREQICQTQKRQQFYLIKIIYSNQPIHFFILLKPVFVNMEIVDGKQNFGSQLIAVNQMRYVGFAMVQAGMASAVRIEGLELLFSLRRFFLHLPALLVQNQCFLGFCNQERVADFECFKSELQGMLNILKFSMTCQDQSELFAIKVGILPIIFLLEASQHNLKYLFSFGQSFSGAEIAKDDSFNCIVQDLLQASGDKTGIYPPMQSSQPDWLALIVIVLLVPRVLGQLEIRFSFVYGSFIALVGILLMVFLERWVFGQANEKVGLDEVYHVVIHLRSNLGVPFVTLYLHLRVLVAAGHAVRFGEIVRSQVSEYILREGHKFLEGQSLRQIFYRLGVVVKIAIAKLHGRNGFGEIRGSQVVQ